MADKHLITIGIHEPVNLPKLGFSNIDSKTDTGAYNSAIDCSFAEEVITKNGTKKLVYILFHENGPHYTGKKRSTKKYKKKIIRSSNGTTNTRYQIKLRIELKGLCCRTTFNLSDRSEMRYSLLLGRKLLADRFVVDVSKNRKVRKSKSL